MPCSEETADWILVVGRHKTRVGVPHTFVRNFRAISRPFDDKFRDVKVSLSSEIPLPELRRFTSKMEYYIMEAEPITGAWPQRISPATYDDDINVHYHVWAPHRRRRDHPSRKWLGGKTPQLPHELALERSVVNVEMFAFAEQFAIEALRAKALKKLQRSLPGAWLNPAFSGLICAADAPEAPNCSQLLREETRRAIRTKELPHRDWENTMKTLTNALDDFKQTGASNWRDEEDSILRFIAAVDGGRKHRSVLYG